MLESNDSSNESLTNVSRLDPDTSTSASVWEEVTKLLARLGKQQLRTMQNTALLAEQGRDLLDEVHNLTNTLHEQSDALRRGNRQLREDARSIATKLLAVIDSIDDIGALARQRGDQQWLKYVERLSADTLMMFASIGIVEISAARRVFDPEEHEALDTVEREQGARQYEIVEVLQRGFRYNGTVLRRARVITAR